MIVKEALMIEPTESESKTSLDNYIDALLKIADEDVQTVLNAPTNTKVRRLDEALAVKNPIFTWKMKQKTLTTEEKQTRCESVGRHH